MTINIEQAPITVSLSEDFRRAMGRVCTPVSIVTTMLEGAPYGTTVSAFASLSKAPPMVLVSLDSGSDSLSVIERSGRFGLNVLSSEQSLQAMHFAGKGGTEKFDVIPWDEVDGVPRLDGTCSFTACEVESITLGGDHKIILGRVIDVVLGDAEPLTYHRRTFGTHQRIAS